MTTPTCTVEIAFASDPLDTPSWTDVTAYVQDWTISRGRTHALDTMSAGQATVTLDNRDGRFDPNNASGPYWPNVVQMRGIRILAHLGATTYPRFRGYVTQWPQAHQIGDATVQIQCADAFTVFTLARLKLPFTPYTDSSLLTHEIVTWVANTIGWPSGDRDIHSGVFHALLSADLKTVPLQILTDTAKCEAGAIFITAAGQLAYYPYNELRARAVEAAFSNDETSDDLLYSDVLEINDDAHLYNQILLTPTGIPQPTSPQTDPVPADLTQDVQLDDSGSVDRYLPRQLTDSVPLTNLVDLKSLALALLTDYHLPRTYVSEITLEWADDDDVTAQMLARDLMDAVTVTYWPQTGGDPHTSDYLIEHIDEAFTLNEQEFSWIVKWGLCPVPSGPALSAETPPEAAPTIVLFETAYLSETFAQSLSS